MIGIKRKVSRAGKKYSKTILEYGLDPKRRQNRKFQENEKLDLEDE
jgi:hypothetical protein